MPKILFRVDAGHRMGTGHLYECLWFARARDFESVFCVNNRAAADLVRHYGFRAQIGSMNKLIVREKPAVAVLDLPDLRQAELDRVELRGAKLLALNALLHPVAAPCQVATVFTPHPKNKQYHGVKYILLRPAFARAKGGAARSAVRNILLMFGGADPGNFSLKALRALAAISGNFKINVIAGAAQRHMPEINKFLKRFGKRAALHHHITADRQLISLMRGADLALCSGGYTLAELMRLGVPSVALAQNGIEEHRVFANFPQNAFVNLGRGRAVAPRRLRTVVARLIADAPQRKRLSAAARRVVDGRGIARLRRILLQLINQHGN